MALTKEIIVDHIALHPTHSIWSSVLGVWMFTDSDTNSVADHSPNGNNLTCVLRGSVGESDSCAWGESGDNRYLSIRNNNDPGTNPAGAYIADIELNDSNEDITIIFVDAAMQAAGGGLGFSKYVSGSSYTVYLYCYNTATGHENDIAGNITGNKWTPAIGENGDETEVTIEEYSVFTIQGYDAEPTNLTYLRHGEAIGPAEIFDYGTSNTGRYNEYNDTVEEEPIEHTFWNGSDIAVEDNLFSIGHVTVEGHTSSAGICYQEHRFYAILIWEKKLSVEQIEIIEDALNGTPIPSDPPAEVDDLTASADVIGAPAAISAVCDDVDSIDLSFSQGSKNSQIVLNWTKSIQATGYKIYRDTTSSATTLYDTVGDVSTYTDTEVSDGQIYYYRIKATNDGGDSGYSNEASDTWYDLDHYEITRNTESPAESGDIIADSVSSAATTYEDTDVIEGNTYYYKIRSINTNDDETDWSNEVYALCDYPDLIVPVVAHQIAERNNKILGGKQTVYGG